jgi:phosphoenolpyruvate carboxylase
LPSRPAAQLPSRPAAQLPAGRRITHLKPSAAELPPFRIVAKQAVWEKAWARTVTTKLQLTMESKTRFKEFRRLVRNKFNVFNSLFLSLPFKQIRTTGVLIPLLQNECLEGLRNGKEPIDILESFFTSRPELKSDKDKIDFMFRVIQYVERQIVLFDSVEDAAFPELHSGNEELSLRDYIQITDSSSGVKSAEMSALELLANFQTRIVFTAHPTQFYPPSVLKIIARLRHFISGNDISSIDMTLQQLGLTSLLKSTKPTPLEEAQNIIYFLRNVYYDAVGELYTDLKAATSNAGFKNAKILQLGFWPGGDRDGNPFVTFDTTEAVANELRMTLMKCYYNDLKDLQGKLTFRNVEPILEELTRVIYETMFDAECLLSTEEIEQPLLQIRGLLHDEYNGLYLEDIDSLIDKVNLFKTHFAALDIRQNHSVHLRLITSILVQQGLIEESLHELTDPELVDILLNQSFELHPEDVEDSLLQDTIRTIRGVAEIQSRNGEAGCNRYVISNSEDTYSVLFVYALFRWCWGSDTFPIDIIPLFESVEGMDNARQIMDDLFSLPAYCAHVARRNETQTMMLGFSDGTKDGGYLMANWSIHKTKEELSDICEEKGVRAVFFDGRGGPPARGGGKTHRFYASQSEKIANHAIELTIQGQVITSMYGTKEQFKYQAEQLIAAGLHKDVLGQKNHISSHFRSLFDELATLSYQSYTELKNHPMFLPYLEKKSTLRFYARANVGSRPSVRGSGEKLEFKNLRAIPFVGSWSQLKQNVPGYFGIGSAFKTIADDGRLEDLQDLFRDVPFFKTLVLNSMMSLSKCNFALTQYMAHDPEFGDFWKLLKDEYELSLKMVLLISGYDGLMEEEATSKESVSIREDIVMPLLIIQQYALQKLERGNGLLDHKEEYEKIVIRSLYGNINASRNSA